MKAYAAHGGIQRLTRGDGITETTVYNTRLQPVSMAAGTLWSASLYYCDNEVAQCGTNNGNLMEQKVTARPDATAAAATFVTTYDYDKANRLCAAVEGAVRIAITTHCDAKQLSANWWQDFAYDTTGNRALLTGSFGTAGNNQPQVSSLATAVPYANFRWSGSGYDARGNVNLLFGASAGAGQQGPGMSYDAESRIVSVTASTMPAISYVYDGEGRRVLKTVGSVTTELVYDGMGELVTEYGGTATASDPTIYLTSDWLGSTRMVTAPASGTSQPKVVELRDYAPFGEELGLAVGGRGVKYAPPTYPSVVPDAVGQKFTGKQRDAESGLDYFGARYFSGAQGRFTSPDPLLSSAHILSPQSWNRYSYALNNPLRFTDPLGLYVCNGASSECRDFESALKDVERARNTYKKGSAQYNALNGSLQAYGKKGVDNGVSVQFGATKSGGAGETNIGIAISAGSGTKRVTADNPSGQNTVVTFDLGKNSGSGLLGVSAAHEGIHVGDGTALAGALPMDLTGGEASAVLGGAFNLTKYATELSAYGASSFAGQGLGFGSLKVGGNFEIWNSGWKAADVNTLRSNGINGVLSDPNGLYKVTPGAPGKKLIE